MTAVAEIKDLRVEIDGRAIVDGVSFQAQPGKVTALVGASGSGKTTTGLALLGEYPACARVTGDVRVSNGLVGYVPQHPGAVLNPARRVGALLRDIARDQVSGLPRLERRAAARTRILHALSAAQLPEGESLLRRYPHQLSGGQQQRAVLAQALLLGASVVVADEPTTGQDVLTKRHIVDQLAAVARQGVAVVLLSHDLDVVRALADEVLVMRGGRVVEAAPAEQLWLAPQHPWTAELLAAEGKKGHSPPARDGHAALQVRGLTARHRDGTRRTTEAVRIPELTLRAGECLAVVGRSGSGKTTLARCLAGLHRNYEGEVRLDGTPLPRSLRARTREQLAAVQYVFQDANAAFDEHRPVLDQVARTAVRLRGAHLREALADALNTLTGLGLTEELVRHRPGQLSGGELQRTALARALLARPRVLICDEITSGLDTVTRRGLLDTLAVLLRDRPELALVLITHDLDTAATAARIAVLDAGELIEQGPAQQVLTAPRHRFTASLVAGSVRLAADTRP
ncbi:ABC transporter ATP-binding protein [Streptomyces sp. NBC_01794]|uniref:ABC transporter ATP-binding protein n=1 Tax=Streptomyces sp. NBC_01794 TaxID=2975942 RepID=UPI003087471F|nr:ATP-binding cassette domain-containing protein [Streptomyces sp. NBC_01794]